MRIIRKNNGFSLIQVVVASGIVSIISLVVAQMIIDSNKAVKSAQDKIDQLVTYSIIRDSIARESSCKTAMAGNTFIGNKTGVSQDISLTMSDGTVFKKNSKIPNTNLKFKSLTLTPLSLGVSGTAPNTTFYLSELWAQTQAISNNVGGSLYKKKRVGAFYVTVDDKNKIVNCSSETSIASLCKHIKGGVYNSSTTECTISTSPPSDSTSGTKDCNDGWDSILNASSSGTSTPLMNIDLTDKWRKFPKKLIHGQIHTGNISTGCWKYTPTSVTVICLDGKVTKSTSTVSGTMTCSP